VADYTKTFLAGIRSWATRRHPTIFISYRRRGEGAGYGGRIADKLVEHFGKEQCFRDVDDIESGIDFVTTIREAVGTCEVLVAVIGPDWLTQSNDKGMRRLDDPRDFVRLEVAAALERDIRVIPVLVGGAEVPVEGQLPQVLEALSRRQAHELTDSRWEYDVSKLIEAIESIGVKGHSRSKKAASLGIKQVAAVASIVSFVLLATILGSGAFSRPTEQASPTPEPKPSVETDKVAKPDDGQRLEMERRLELQRRQLNDAERRADVDRQARHDSETALARERESRDRQSELMLARERESRERESREREEAAARAQREEAQVAAASTVRANPRGADGIRGNVRVAWEHEGVVYTAAVSTTGSQGLALVTYRDPQTGLQIGAEQDLSLLQNAQGTFFIGSNSRLPGTRIPHPSYAPDIFRLSRMQNGVWAITEVGPSWDHFDRAVVVE
jgi:TIR domain